MSNTYPELPNTNFPDRLDNFPSFLNINASDGNYIKRYQLAIQEGDYNKAQEAYKEIPNVERKLISAKHLNKLSDACLAVEKFYKTDIKDYIENKQKEWEIIVDRFQYKGIWNAGTQYEKNNYVDYIVDGNKLLYIATSKPPLGTRPTDPNYWRIFGIKGAQGEAGKGLVFALKWDATARYGVGNVVTYENALWVSLKENINNSPYIDSDIWEMIGRLELATYPVQAATPTNQKSGELWFKVIN